MINGAFSMVSVAPMKVAFSFTTVPLDIIIGYVPIGDEEVASHDNSGEP